MKTPGRRCATWVATLIVLALATCRRTPAPSASIEPRPALGAVEVLLEDGAPEPVADRSALEKRARTHLLALFANSGADAATGPVARVRIEVATEFVSIPGKTAERARARLRIEIRPENSAAGHFREDAQVQAEETSSAESAPATMRSLIERILDELVQGYLTRQQLWLGDPRLVKAALNGDNGDLRLEAIRAVAARKLLDEVPVLLRLLSDDDEVTRDTALGALVQLRERRAVAELTRSRSMRDRREMRKIVDAVAAIGGKEAADYLSFVADAHEDEELRTMARAALQRLMRTSANAQ